MSKNVNLMRGISIYTSSGASRDGNVFKYHVRQQWVRRRSVVKAWKKRSLRPSPPSYPPNPTTRYANRPTISVGGGGVWRHLRRRRRRQQMVNTVCYQCQGLLLSGAHTRTRTHVHNNKTEADLLIIFGQWQLFNIIIFVSVPPLLFCFFFF